MYVPGFVNPFPSSGRESRSSSCKETSVNKEIGVSSASWCVQCKMWGSPAIFDLCEFEEDSLENAEGL